MKASVKLLLSLMCAAACTGSALADEPVILSANSELLPVIVEKPPENGENGADTAPMPDNTAEKDDVSPIEPTEAPESEPEEPDIDSGFLIEPEPEPEPETIVLTRFDTQTNVDLTAVACGDADALHAFFRDTRDGLCGYDADGTPHDFFTGEWDFSAVDLDTPGIYNATAPLLLVDEEDRPRFSLAEGVEAPVIYCRVSVQQSGRPEIGEFIAARGQMIFPWVLTEEQTGQLDRFTVWFRPENGTWEPLTRGVSLQKDALTLYSRTCGLENGTTYALQVDYPDGHTGILTFTYDAVAVKLGYSEGNRDGGGEDTRLPDIIQPAPDGSHSGGSHHRPSMPEPAPDEPETPPTEPAEETPAVPSVGQQEQPEEPEKNEQPSAAPVIEQDTADGAVLSGTRLQALIELDEPLTISKDGVSVSISADALRELQPTDTDALVVRLRRSDEGSIQAELRLNGEKIEPSDGVTLTTDDRIENSAADSAEPVRERRSPLPFAAAGAAVLSTVLCLIRWRKHL